MQKLLTTFALIVLFNCVLIAQPLTWQKSFNLINGDDESWAVCEADSSNIFVGGLTSHPGKGVVLKLNKFGDLIWQKTFEDSYYITDLLHLPDDGLIYSANAVLRRLDNNGNTIWSAEEPYSYGLHLTADSFLIAPFYGLYKKYNLDGKLIWEKNIGGYPYFTDCFEVNINNFILIGAKNYSAFLLNIDSSGNIIRTRQYISNKNSYFSSIVKLNNGYLLSGGFNGNTDTSKFFMLHLSENLDSINFKIVYTNNPIRGNKLIKIENKIYYFFNYYNREIYKECFIISRYDTNLNFISKTLFNPLVNWTIFADAIIFPGSNNMRFAITGTTSVNGISDEDIYVASIDTALNPLIGIQPISNIIPDEFLLKQNYPNPFNPVTTIGFSIPNTQKNEPVKLIIYDVLGRKIDEPVNEILVPGEYEFSWNAENFSSGVYFYSLQLGETRMNRKMILLK